MIFRTYYSRIALSASLLAKPTISKMSMSDQDLSTGISFPRTLRGLKLFGCGLRQVTVFRFNTYALGIYFDADEAAKSWKSNINNSIGSYSDAEKFVNALSTVTLRLCPVRNTNGTHLRNAFSRLFEEFRNENCDNEEQKEKAKADINEFVTSFPQNLPQGSELLIKLTPETGEIDMEFEGTPIKHFESKWLCSKIAVAYVDPTRNLIPALITQVKEHLIEEI